MARLRLAYLFTLAAGLVAAQTANGFDFVDGFEAPTLNPFWSTYTQSGSISLSTAEAHTGLQSVQFTSTDTGLDKYVYLFHNFATPVYGDTSVWIYDTGAGQSSSNYIAFQISNSHLGLNGTSGLTTTDYDLPGNGDNYYYYDLKTIDSFERSSVPRTLAWHQYSILDTPLSLTLMVDGITVFTKTSSSPFDQILLYMQAPSWRPAWVSYYDDFSFTQVSAVPEPSSLTIVAIGAPAFLAWLPCRRRRESVSRDVPRGLFGIIRLLTTCSDRPDP